MLRELARTVGALPRPAMGKQRSRVQKRLEGIREKLRHHFNIAADPIPFNGSSYQATFRLRHGPSFDS
jgi:hypothetical protein